MYVGAVARCFVVVRDRVCVCVRACVCVCVFVCVCQDGETALLLAAAGGHVGVYDALLAAGARQDAIDMVRAPCVRPRRGVTCIHATRQGWRVLPVARGDERTPQDGRPYC